MKNKVMIGAIFMLLFSCAAKDASSSSEDLDSNSRGQWGKFAECPWYMDRTCEEGYLCGFGLANKANPGLAIKIATQRARADLVEQINVRVQSMVRDHMEESGVSGQSVATEYTEAIGKSVADQSLQGSSADEQCMLSDNTVIVRVVWNKTVAVEATAAAAKKEEAMYSKFLGEQAFERLENEIEKSDRWDEDLD